MKPWKLLAGTVALLAGVVMGQWSVSWIPIPAAIGQQPVAPVAATGQTPNLCEQVRGLQTRLGALRDEIVQAFNTARANPSFLTAFCQTRGPAERDCDIINLCASSSVRGVGVLTNHCQY